MTDNGEEIPRHELLIKIMGMTTAENDNQALVALRKANALMREAGWDWERLLRNKIKVVENPFAGKNPFEGLPQRDPDDSFGMAGGVRSRVQPQPVRTAAQATASQPTRPPRPSMNPGVGHWWDWNISTSRWEIVKDPSYVPPRSRSPVINSVRKNLYAGYCYCCGDYVDNDIGFVFEPKKLNPSAVTASRSGWAIACTSCNSAASMTIASRAAPKNTGQTVVNVSLGDL